MSIEFSSIFSIRTSNCLKWSCNIHTWEDLVKNTTDDLLKTPNFGRKSLNEITDFLKQYNMELGNPYVNDDLKQYLTKHTQVPFSERDKDLITLLQKDKTMTLTQIKLSMGVSIERARQIVLHCYRNIKRIYLYIGNEACLPNKEDEALTKERLKIINHYIENYLFV